MARELGLARPRSGGFKGFVEQFAATAAAYAGHVYGPAAPARVVERIDADRVPGEPAFFSLFEDTEYDAGSHWDVLIGFLGFRFDTLAFSFSETDCANPALMAHLRGLRAERLWGRPYAEGVAEYRDYALRLMRHKQFPEPLVAAMERRYATPAAIAEVRDRVERYAAEVLRLEEPQLVCMVYAPFVGRGRNLARYLAAEHPCWSASAPAFEAVLHGRSDDPVFAGLLAGWSGLPLAQLRHLYRTAPSDNSGADPQFVGPIRVLFRRDPHQAEIRTRHRPAGPAVVEIESGR